MHLLAIEIVRGSEKNGFRILVLGQEALEIGFATPRKSVNDDFKSFGIPFIAIVRYWTVA